MEQILAIIAGPIASHLQGDFLSSYFSNKVLEKRVKFFLSLLVAFLCGLALHYGDFMMYGDFDWESVFQNAGIVFATSQSYYNMYFKLKK